MQIEYLMTLKMTPYDSDIFRQSSKIQFLIIFNNKNKYGRMYYITHVWNKTFLTNELPQSRLLYVFCPKLFAYYKYLKSFWKGATSAKWEPFPVSLAFGAAIRGWVNQILVLRRVIKTSRSTARCFDDSTQRDDLFCWTAGRAAESQWNRKWLSFGGSSTFLKNFHIFLFRMKFGRKNI